MISLRFIRHLLCACAFLHAGAHAAVDPAALSALAGDDADARIEAVNQLALAADADAMRVLAAIKAEQVYLTPDARVLVVQDDQAWDPATGATTTLPDGADGLMVNNRLRAAIDAALAAADLAAPRREQRLAAARAIQAAGVEAAQAPMLRRALERESDSELRDLLAQLAASAELQSPSVATRLHAARTLADSTDAQVRPLIQARLAGAETNATVRAALTASLRAINARISRTEFIGNLFYGLSLASVLLLAALGLAITFGLMGIINMAHGELLMIGAYTTYLVQTLFRHYLPGALDWYLLAALPAAFAVAAGVGMLLERTVIRWLYGRPLETLLATWGISLLLMQTVRTLFGAQNVEVANPAWMSGGITVLGSLVLAWNRLVIIAFAVAVVSALWLILNKTRLGLFVRAVMQNRRMADCVGVPTGRIDMLTFGLGSGVAGLAGVALSQLGNVGPDLGQAYIIDSFMVVVLGGVGQLAGTIIAAVGLGEINKLLEPAAGAVIAKILILVFIIIFIQRRPQGLFALKGRSVE
ncbi:MAG: urea ABC transporter permease subunit UrtB [Gammaproteobacteria bacterium]